MKSISLKVTGKSGRQRPARARRAGTGRRLVLERLEERIALSGLLNGDFSISNPSDPNYGWTTQGNASIANGQGILDEGTSVETQFSQSFTIAPGTTTLEFTIVASDLVANGASSPPDAFEAALLNSQTNQPLIGPPTGLSSTDAFLNIQQTGEVYFAPQVTVPGAGASGSVASLSFPEEITVDVSSVPANTQATLYFDLIGFSPASSVVRVTDVTVNQGPAPPSVEFTLDPATDSGVIGDDITNFDPVNLIGVTDPNLTVSLDTTGNGFNNGTTTSDANGHFTFTGVTLAQGPNPVRVEATNAQGTAIASQTITIDDQAPTGTLVTPAPNSTTGQDLGYVDIQWSDAGVAAIDPTTFGIGNVTITGVTVDGVQDLGNDLERYEYNLNGGTLSPGPINVSLVAGQVADLAGNKNAATTQSFTYQPAVVLAPTANAQSVTAAEDTPVGITVTGSDPNSPPLALGFAESTNPAHGTLSGTAPNLTYTPTGGYIGADSFQFTDSNGVQTSSPATVSITVVGAPTVTGPISLTTRENQAITFGLTGTDPNSPPLAQTFTVTEQPLHGTLTGTAPTLTYTPDPGYYGTDVFQITDSNGVATSGPASVSIRIVGQPRANAQSVTTLEDTATGITLEGSDPNSPPLALSYSVTANPAHGTLSGTAPNLTYTPDNGYSGTDSFQFTDSNGVATSGAATVSITVTSAQATTSLKAQNLFYTITKNGQLTVNAPGVLAFVTPQVPGLSAAFNGPGPSHGALASFSNGYFQYTPNIGYTGQDTFTYQATAGSSVSNVATITVTIKPSVSTSPGPPRLLPDTPYFNYVRRRRSIDPVRFDYWHPQIGALIGMEISGIPTTPTTIVSKNAHFNAAADRKLHAENPQQFDQTKPVLGALFELETPGAGLTNLLPDTAHYTEQRALYESNPTKYQLKNVYLGAIFAIEDFEQGVSTPAAATAVQSSASVVKVGRVHPAAAQMGHGKFGIAATR
jgi:hypothetical protein